MSIRVLAFSVVRVRWKKPKHLYSFLTQNDHKKFSGPYILLDYLVPYQFIAQTETKMFWQRAENRQILTYCDYLM